MKNWASLQYHPPVQLRRRVLNTFMKRYEKKVESTSLKLTSKATSTLSHAKHSWAERHTSKTFWISTAYGTIAVVVTAVTVLILLAP